VITALAEPDDRAGLVAAFYIVGYLAFSVPALVAGVATTAFGLHSTALVYSGSLAVLAAAAVGILLLRRLGRLPRFCLQLRDLLAGWSSASSSAMAAFMRASICHRRGLRYPQHDCT
jgi:hypothetical protein